MHMTSSANCIWAYIPWFRTPWYRCKMWKACSCSVYSLLRSWTKISVGWPALHALHCTKVTLERDCFSATSERLKYFARRLRMFLNFPNQKPPESSNALSKRDKSCKSSFLPVKTKLRTVNTHLWRLKCLAFQFLQIYLLLSLFLLINVIIDQDSRMNLTEKSCKYALIKTCWNQAQFYTYKKLEEKSTSLIKQMKQAVLCKNVVTASEVELDWYLQFTQISMKPVFHLKLSQ